MNNVILFVGPPHKSVYAYQATTGMVDEYHQYGELIGATPVRSFGPLSQQDYLSLVSDVAALEETKTRLLGPLGTPKRDLYEAMHRETLANIIAARERPPAV